MSPVSHDLMKKIGPRRTEILEHPSATIGAPAYCRKTLATRDPLFELPPLAEFDWRILAGLRSHQHRLRWSPVLSPCKI